MSLLDMIGPIMIGPSSSHTAGACRLALLARHTLQRPAERAKLTLHGSFAKTAKGHGTELALTAGILGYYPHDPRIPQALSIAKKQQLDIVFDAADLGDVHPNTVCIELENRTEKSHLTGSSLGGGSIQVFEIDAFEVRFSGRYHTLLLRHLDQTGVIAHVAQVIADNEGNIATLYSARQKKGGEAMMSIEIDKRLSQYVLDYLTHLPYIRWLRILPEVISGEGHLSGTGDVA